MFLSFTPEEPFARRLIHSYGIIDANDDAWDSQPKRMISDTFPEIWISEDQEKFSWSRDGINLSTSEANGIWGSLNGYVDVSLPNIRVFFVKLYPWALQQLFGISPEFIADQFIPFNELKKEQVEYLIRLRHSSQFEIRTQALQYFIDQKIKSQGLPEADSERLFHHLFSAQGLGRVNDYSELFGWSRQHMFRFSKKHFGMSLKEMGQNFRIRALVDKKFENPEMSLTELAYCFGYFDQAHLTHDFYTLIGKSPTRFFNEQHLIRWHI